MAPPDVVAWWRTARASFAELLPRVVAQLDDEARRLERLLDRSDESVLCFLGLSGVGKSTLLNALVAGSELVVPAGGTGPLTAIATEVRYSARPYFKVLYHHVRKLRGVLLALERRAAADGKMPAAELPQPEREERTEDTADWIDELLTDDAAADEAVKSPDKAIEALIREAQRMVTGDSSRPSPELPYIIAGLRHALGMRAGMPVAEQDLLVVSCLREALEWSRTGIPRYVTQAESDKPAFAAALRAHAAGSLTPIVKTIEVGWPSDLVRDGLVLVDLPGVGVAGDDFQRATQEYIGRRARGVALVVRKGLTEPEMNLLRSSGYWERVLLTASDPEADPCNLLVIVTDVDSPLQQRLMDADPTTLDIVHEYQSLRDELTQTIMLQARTELSKLSDVKSADPGLRENARIGDTNDFGGPASLPGISLRLPQVARTEPRPPGVGDDRQRYGNTGPDPPSCESRRTKPCDPLRVATGISRSPRQHRAIRH